MRLLTLLLVCVPLLAADPKSKPPADVAAKDEEKIEEFEWKGEKRTRVVRTLDLGGEKIEFVKIPNGKFKMGAPATDIHVRNDEKPQHTVTFTKDCWVAKYPVTKGQFAAFVKLKDYKTESESNDGGNGITWKNNKVFGFSRDKLYSWKDSGWRQTDQHPVVNVTWNDAQKFGEWAAKQTKLKVRLVSESEYEYINRGGTDTSYVSGDTVDDLEGYANIADKSLKKKWNDIGVSSDFDDSEPFTSKVGAYKPNGFGLYDTTGNVSCWCADWYDGKLYKRGDVTDPSMNTDGEQSRRVTRGGNWYDTSGCRAASRDSKPPSDCASYLGFRLAFTTE